MTNSLKMIENAVSYGDKTLVCDTVIVVYATGSEKSRLTKHN